MLRFDDTANLNALVAVEEAELMDVERQMLPANYFEISDRKFVKLFRLKKYMVDDLIVKLTPHMIQPTRTSALTVELKVKFNSHTLNKIWYVTVYFIYLGFECFTFLCIGKLPTRYC